MAFFIINIKKVVFVMAKTVKLTDDGLKKLKDELEHLKTVGRADIAEKIKVARGYGDLSENSEYDEAKNEQAKIEARIVEIEAMLKNVEIISDVKGAFGLFYGRYNFLNPLWLNQLTLKQAPFQLPIHH